MNKRKIMSSVVKSSGGVTYTPSLVTLESGEDIKSVNLTDTDILSGQSIQQILNSGADGAWYRNEIDDAGNPDDYTKWESGDSYSIVNSKTDQPYNPDVTGCRNIVGGYRNKISGDDSLVIGHDNISEGNQNLVLGCNNVANSSSSIVLSDAGWSLKARYTDSTSLSKLTYTIEELDRDMLLASIFLSAGSVSIKLRNIPVIGNIDGGLIEFDKQDTEAVTAVYGTDPDKTVTIDFSICQTSQSCSISMGGIANNDTVGYYSLAMNGGITDGMGAIATGYGAYSRNFSLALGALANASHGSIALTNSEAQNESIAIPSITRYSCKGRFDNDGNKLILSDLSDEDFDAIDGGSGTMTTRCYVNIYNTCIGEGMIYKDSSDGSYYMYRNNLVFIKSPVVGQTYNVTIQVQSYASDSSVSIGGNRTYNNSLCVGHMNTTGSMGQNCALFGNNNIAQNASEIAVGSWNRSSENTKFTVGIGTSSTDRKNAFEVTSDGSVYINGVGDYVGNNASSTNSVKAVIDGKQDTLVSGTSIKTINGQSILGEGNIDIESGSTGISDAPQDGKKYVRSNASWVEETTVDTSSFATKEEVTSQLQSKQNVISVEQVSESEKEIQPDVYYIFGEKETLTITLASTDSDYYHEYMFEFNSGTTTTTLNVPETVKWIGDHTVEANKTYQVSIVNNLAVMGGA